LLLFAGVDTTHHVLQWALLNLALNERVQQKLYEEVVSVLGKDGVLDVEHLTKLPYMGHFLRENHRSTPPFSGAVIRRLEEDVDVCGYLVPKQVRSVKLFSLPLCCKCQREIVQAHDGE